MNFGRLWAIAQRETRELRRDPLRLVFYFVVPVVLMLLFGYGLNLDIEDIPFVVVDQDNSPYSREYIDHFSHSRYFMYEGNMSDPKEVEWQFMDGNIRLYFEIPHGFGADLLAGKSPQVGILIDGTMPFRADTIKGYVDAMHISLAGRFAVESTAPITTVMPVKVETRFWYNQALESKFAFVPGLIAVNLLALSAIFTAVSLAREKEFGTITNFYATPTSRLEYLWGKQLPYVVIGLINAAILFMMTLWLFDVPMKGSLLAFIIGGVFYIMASTSMGLVIGALARSQIAAILVTMILTMIPSFQYSGLFTPTSAMEESLQVIAHLYPTMYFLDISVGTFTKGIGFEAQIPNIAALAGFFVVLSGLTAWLFPKQEA